MRLKCPGCKYTQKDMTDLHYEYQYVVLYTSHPSIMTVKYQVCNTIRNFIVITELE